MFGAFEFGQPAFGDIDPLIIKNISLNDSGVSSDVVANQATLSISDSGTSNDTISIQNILKLVDNGLGTDILTSITNQLSLSESGVGTDTIVDPTVDLSISESGSGIDTLSILASLGITDEGIANEILNILNQFSITDEGSLIDNLDSLESLVNISDDGVVSETISELLSDISLDDSGNGSETILIGFIRQLLHLTVQATKLKVKKVVTDRLLEESSSGSSLVSFGGGNFGSYIFGGEDLSSGGYTRKDSEGIIRSSINNSKLKIRKVI